MTQELIDGILSSDNFLIYLNFIEKCKDEITPDLIGERHHIIPRCMNGSNKRSNLILLSYENHYKAHKLLAELFPDCNEFIAGWWLIAHTQGRTNELTAEEFAELRYKYKKKCKEFFSIHPNKGAQGKSWYNDGTIERLYKNTDIIPDTFIKGRLPIEKDTRSKISNNATNSRWYNNGVVESFSVTCPDGFVLGRLPVGKWYNNGVSEIQVKNDEFVPDGYVKGRLKWSDERRKSICGLNNPHAKKVRGVKNI